jgi:hypothetical protein
MNFREPTQLYWVNCKDDSSKNGVILTTQEEESAHLSWDAS